MERSYVGLWIGKLGNTNFWYHTYPFAISEKTKFLHIVRSGRGSGVIPNLKYHLFKSRNKLLDLFVALFIGRDVIRKNKIDFIVNFNPAPWGIISWILSKVYHIPIMVGFIGSDINIKMKNPFYNLILKKIIPKCDIITVTGIEMKKKLLRQIKIDKDKIHIFPHCVKDDWFLTRTETKYDIITAGRLIKLKKIDDILIALRKVHNKGHYLNLAILGEGPEKNRLVKLSKKLDLEKYVDFVGYTDDVKNYFKSARIYVQSSIAEGLSLSLIEAYASGLVIVASKAGCEEDLISNGINGILVKINSPEQIANAILSLLEKDTYRKIHNSIIETRKKLKVENAVTTCTNLINILGKHSERDEISNPKTNYRLTK